MTHADEIRSILVTARLLGVQPTYSGYKAVQLWADELDDGTPADQILRHVRTDAEIVAAARSWIASVRMIAAREGTRRFR